MLEQLSKTKGNLILMTLKENNFKTDFSWLLEVEKKVSVSYSIAKNVLQVQRRNIFIIGRGSIRHWLNLWLSGTPQLKDYISVRRDVLIQ